MTIGITARQFLNNPVATEKAVVVEITANAVPGTSEHLLDRVRAQANYNPSAILISNNSVASVYLQSTSTTGTGIIIPPNGSILLPVTGGCDLKLENANSIWVLCYE